MIRLTLGLLLTLVGTAAWGQTPPQPSRPGAGERPRSARAAARPGSTLRLLNTRLAQLDFQQRPLAEVLAELAEATGATIVARWKRLAEAGVEPQQPISLKARNLRLSQVLWLILNEVAAPEHELAYRADGETVTISSAADFGRVMIVRSYDVHDLIAPRPETAMLWSGRQRSAVVGVNVNVARGAVAAQPIVGQLGSGIYLGGSGDPRRAELEGRIDADREAHLRELIELIVATIEPDSWAANGGDGTISAYRGRLVVRNSPLVHQQLAGYLRSLRAP